MKSCCPSHASAPGRPELPALSAEAMSALLAGRGRFVEFVQRRVGTRERAEEIVQDAYARALERGAQLRDDRLAVPWFFRILRNTIVERARREVAATSALKGMQDELRVIEGGSVAPDDARRTCGCVNGALLTLKPEHQAPVRAVDLDGRALRAFAADAGISANHAAVRLHRGRAALRARLHATCGACAAGGCGDCTCAAESASETSLNAPAE